MLSLTKPEHVVPYHGEARHQHKFRMLAEEVGIPLENVHLVQPYEVLEITETSVGVVDRLPGEAMLVDGEGGFRYEGLNPAHQRATGLRESDLKGKRPHECLPQEVADHVEANYRRCLDSQQMVAYEEELNLPNGRINWLTQLIPLRHSDGRIARLFGICTDLTRLKDQEKALRLAQRQESIGRLTSGIAHDFNNLLTVILCQLDCMEQELQSNPEMIESLGEIGEAARHAAELTRGLLTYSSQSEGKFAPQSLTQLITQFQRILN